MYNKHQLIEDIYKSGEVQTKSQAERIIDLVFLNIMKGAKADKASIAGFGIFSTKAMKGRNGRNPRTGESVKVEARTKVKFTVAKAFKEFVNKQ